MAALSPHIKHDVLIQHALLNVFWFERNRAKIPDSRACYEIRFGFESDRHGMLAIFSQSGGASFIETDDRDFSIRDAR